MKKRSSLESPMFSRSLEEEMLIRVLKTRVSVELVEDWEEELKKTKEPSIEE
jgi:hypothetical protein